MRPNSPKDLKHNREKTLQITMFDTNNGELQPNANPDTTEEKMNEEIDLESLDQESDVEKLRTQLRTTVEQKKHFRDKVAKLESDPRFKAPVEPPAQKPKAKAGEIDPSELEARIEDKFYTRQKYPDMTPEEVERAQNLAKFENKKFSEVVEDGYFQAYMRSNRDQMAKEKARPNPSNRSGNPSNHSIADLSDPVKVANMDDKTFEDLSNEAGKRRFTR